MVMPRRIASALLLSLCASIAAAAEVWVVELDGSITPASADYFLKALDDAQDAGAAAVVMRLDTPGGLDQAMRDMIKAILASPIPVVTYVAPNGSRAASAGTYLLYASHIAAMAPATNVGSATPVSIGGSPFTPPAPKPAPAPGTGNEDEAKAESPERETTAMERKVVNDAVAYIRGLAELRGRNAEWAEKAVRDAVNLPASDALAAKVIDVVAEDVDALLAAIDGRTVKTSAGELTLVVKGATVHAVVPGWRHELLSLITDPNVAYILLMIGLYGLILEFYNPGFGVPGVTGVICLLLAAYALQMLPVNYAGLALMLLGITLMVAEAFTPSVGVLGVGGVIAFVAGSIILFDSDLPGYRISIPIIAAFAAGTAALFLFATGAAMRARKLNVATGREAMVGAEAVALGDFERDGWVRAFGENWQARADRPARKGDRLRVRAVDGLVLDVTSEESSP
jgi:membrane-bound serine protease (ClpP class)